MLLCGLTGKDLRRILVFIHVQCMSYNYGVIKENGHIHANRFKVNNIADIRMQIFFPDKYVDYKYC